MTQNFPIASSYRFLGIAGPLALLLFPFVHRFHSQLPSNGLSVTFEAIFAILCSMGFSSPLFLFYAYMRKNHLATINSVNAVLPPGYEAHVAREMRLYYFLAFVGVGLGVLAAAIGVFYFLQR